jgi:hypothetical protein
MTTLDELAKLHETDKASHYHNYTPFYEQILTPLKERPSSLIEFGVKRGSSLRMWEDWLPLAEVVGVDMVPRKMDLPPKRSKVVNADLRDAARLQLICEQFGPFDVAIDDSAHTVDVAQNIVSVLWPNFIKPGGWLVIEDINSGYKRNLRTDQQHDFIGWAKNFVLAVNHHGNLCKCGPNFWERSTEFDKAIKQIVFVPGIMAMQRR